MEITVEIDAPKIIIPEDSSDPAKGGVLLDTGVLCITGVSDNLGIRLNVSLNAVHLG